MYIKKIKARCEAHSYCIVLLAANDCNLLPSATSVVWIEGETKQWVNITVWSPVTKRQEQGKLWVKQKVLLQWIHCKPWGILAVDPFGLKELQSLGKSRPAQQAALIIQTKSEQSENIRNVLCSEIIIIGSYESLLNGLNMLHLSCNKFIQHQILSPL